MLWVLIVGLLLVAWLFVLYPFVGKQQADTEGDLEANLRIFRDHQAQLDDQLNSQQIDQEQYQQLIAEAQQLLLCNTEQVRSEQSSGDQSKGGFWLLPLLLIAVSLFCVAVYKQLGASADQHIAQLIKRNAESESIDQQLQSELYLAIQQRVEQRPDNLYYWVILAKWAVGQGDLEMASQYYAKAIELEPSDGYLHGQYTELLFMLADSQFTDKVIKALDRAFAIDSSNPTVLGLKGIQAFEAQQWQLAITYWQEVDKQINQNSATAVALKTGIARAQTQLGLINKSDRQTPLATVSPAVEILVSIDNSIAYTAEQIVFVALVPTTGSPMPVAARKLRAGDLPTTIILTHADAIMAEHNLSSVSEVKAIARLSQTGSATPQVGDWEATLDKVLVGDKEGKVELQISYQRK
jgi:cytochrome c-type biogenesis protein CcmH